VVLFVRFQLLSFFWSWCFVNNDFKKSLVANHLTLYNTPLNRNYQWTLGFTLVVILAVRLISGIVATGSSYLVGWGAPGVLFGRVRTNFRYVVITLHSVGSSIISLFIILHRIKARRLHDSNTAVWYYGNLINTLCVVTCFLGYSTQFGLRAFWAQRVVLGLQAWLPCVDRWFYSFYVPGYESGTKVFLLHAIRALLQTLFVGVHLLTLHLQGSTSAAAPQSVMSSSLWHTVRVKDVNRVVFAGLVAWAQAFNLIHVLHTDNNIGVEVNSPSGVARIFHIVPEWYLLPVYARIKCVPGAHLGFMAFIVCYTHVIVQDTCDTLISLAGLLLGVLGAYLPLHFTVQCTKALRLLYGVRALWFY
jgi:quinol-cytochrome oxidoreductase complex cytochrome b subunit